MEKKNTARFFLSVYFQDLFAIPLAKFFIKLKLHPNLITFFGLIFSLCSAYQFYISQYVLGAFLFILALIIDSTDGRVARGLNKFSDFGKFLDNICDKLRSFCVVIPLVLSFSYETITSFLLLSLYFFLPILRLINTKLNIFRYEPSIYFWYNLAFINSFLRRKGLCGIYCGWERAFACMCIAPFTNNFALYFSLFVIAEQIIFLIGLYMQYINKDKNESFNF